MSLVELRLSLYSSQTLSWYSDYPNTHQSSRWYSDYPYTHHSLPGGTQTIPIHITVALVVLRLSLYSTKYLLWYTDYPYTHHSPFGGTQTITIFITVSLVALVYQTVPLLITVSPVVLRLSLNSSQSPWWYSDYPNEHQSLPGGTQTTLH